MPVNRARGILAGTALALAVGAPTASAVPTPAPAPVGPPPVNIPGPQVTASPAPAPTASPAPGAPVGGPLLARPGTLVSLPAGVPPPPPLTAGGYVLADADTGAILVSKAAHARAMPASTIKTLTALALVPRLDPATTVTAADEDANVDGTKVGLDPGAPYTVDQLFRAMLMSSANDAAVALARTAGGLDQATAAMNATARHLGARDTLARNTSGLDAKDQMTSAYDLALIGRAAIRDPKISAYITTKTAPFPGGRTKKGQKRAQWQISSHNKLLWNYAGTIGVKNGYTIKARSTYIGAARRGGKTYLMAYVHAEPMDWRTPAALLDWAFAYGPKAAPIGTLVEPGALEPAPEQGPASSVAAAVINSPVQAADALDGIPVAGRVAAGVGLLALLAGGAWWWRARRVTTR